LFGGFEGVGSLDVCSQITGISSTALVKSPEICDDRIDQYVHGKTIIVCTVLCCFVCSYVPSIIQFCINVYFKERLQLLKGRLNILRAAKSASTKHKNQSLLFFGKFVGTVVNSGSSLDTKLQQITAAWVDLSGIVDFGITNNNIVPPPPVEDG
jgi:hypothetical protein